MGLAIFIRSNEEAIVAEWQAFAQTYLPSAEHMDRSTLRDHVIGLLRFIADDLETPETESERSQKAKGQRPRGVAIKMVPPTPMLTFGTRRASIPSK